MVTALTDPVGVLHLAEVMTLQFRFGAGDEANCPKQTQAPLQAHRLDLYQPFS